MNIWAKRFNYFCKGVRSTLRGDDSPMYPLYLIIHFLNRAFLGRETSIAIRDRIRFMGKKFRKHNCWNFNGLRLPLMDEKYENYLCSTVFNETVKPYLLFGDREITKQVHGDGSLVYYGLKTDEVNSVVEAGDIVIDAGSWAGDFAAYASVLGATTYAFEPTPKTFEYLKQTAELNGNITPVNMGLSDKPDSMTLYIDSFNSGGNTLIKGSSLVSNIVESVSVPITTVDDFVKQNGITKVDFIKADIEGFERHMLKGAAKVLREFAPKLAICTYHLPDDPEVLERIILEANPNYRIVHMPQILFADAR